MSDFFDPIPEGLLETAYFAGKAFNSAFANGEIGGGVLAVDRAVEMVAAGVGCGCAESPKEMSVAMLLQFHGPQNVVPLLYQKPDGGLALIEKANRQFIEKKFRRNGTVASSMAKRICMAYQSGAAAGVWLAMPPQSVEELVSRLEAGVSFVSGRRKFKLEINPVPADLRKDVLSCFSFDAASGTLDFVGDRNAPWPAKLNKIDAVGVSRRALTARTSCKLPSLWLEIPRDLLQEWRDSVQEAAEGIVDMCRLALQAGNKEISSAGGVAEVIILLSKTAWGTGGNCNAGYSIHKPKGPMRKALLECLEFKDGTLIFLPNKLPDSSPARKLK